MKALNFQTLAYSYFIKPRKPHSVNILFCKILQIVGKKIQICSLQCPRQQKFLATPLQRSMDHATSGLGSCLFMFFSKFLL